MALLWASMRAMQNAAFTCGVRMTSLAVFLLPCAAGRCHLSIQSLGGADDAAHPSDCLTPCLQIFKEAQTLLPGGVNSPVRAFKSVGGQPIIFDHVEGSHCYDVDGNKVTGLTLDILTLI